MRRVTRCQVTTIKIVSIKLTWTDGPDGPGCQVERQPEPEDDPPHPPACPAPAPCHRSAARRLEALEIAEKAKVLKRFADTSLGKSF